jgi:hypothetical protein
MQDFLTPMNEAAWKIYEETGGNLEAVNAFLREYDLSEVNSLIGSFNDGFKEIFETIEDGLADARDALDKAIQREQQLIDARLSAADSISDLLFDLMGGSMAPVQSLEFFEKRYEQLLAEAQSATTAEEIDRAVSNLTNFVPNYLDFAGAYGGDNYADLFNKITSDLKEIEFSQRSEAERQIQKLDSINTILGKTADAVLSIDEALRQYLGARADAGQGPNTLAGMWEEVKALTPVGDVIDAFKESDLFKLGKMGAGLLGFESGGIVSGPDSGYPVILHGTEKITPINNNHTRSGGGSAPIQLQVQLNMDGQKFQEFTIEVLDNNQEAHRAIARVVNG